MATFPRPFYPLFLIFSANAPRTLSKTVKMKLVLLLLAGLLLLILYTYFRRNSLRQIFLMCCRGILTTKGILQLFVLLGILTSLWRASGTIPLLVDLSLQLIHREAFLFIVFLLNSAMSLLTGTALGTAATTGIICASAGHALGIFPCWTGGAILAGAYFGNRLSPISSMALLTANLTKTDIYKNVHRMLRTTWFPLLLSCCIYLAVGFSGIFQSDSKNFSAEYWQDLFATEYSLSLWSALPAVLMLALSIFKVRSSRVLLFSACAAVPVAFFAEGHSWESLLKMLIFGYSSSVPELSRMMDGGGLVSMKNVFCIVLIAGCFCGIFKGTGMLSPLQGFIFKLSQKSNSFVAKLLTSIFVACITCNQTLTIILTHQLSENLPSQDPALDLYDSAVIVIALVPWSIATAMILSLAGAPSSSVLCASFLYLLPLSRLVHFKGRT